MIPNFNVAVLKRGQAFDEVRFWLGTNAEPQRTYDRQGKEFLSYQYSEQGFSVFLKPDFTLEAIVIDSPYKWAVQGVSIGMTRDQVFSIAGKPSRYWPVRDGVDRWLYDKTDRREFMRVDFLPETGLVNRIIR